MTRQNRVSPSGEITANPWRGGFMGNRGCLHDEHGRLGNSRWKHKIWVTCLLEFNNRHRQLMQPNRYTELFFTDEATALAAGHRPCGECRRADYHAYRAAWTQAHGDMDLKALDTQLHQDRVTRDRAHVRFQADVAMLPDGTFVWANGPVLLWQGQGYHWDNGVYQHITRPTGTVQVLTPRATVAVLQAGYRPQIDPSLKPL